jgi:pentose-5-phosphate-3-epimerase
MCNDPRRSGRLIWPIWLSRSSASSRTASDFIDKIQEARAEIDKYSAKVEIQIDGGIGRNTVRQIAQAGADWIVPGSLMFGEDPEAMRRWLGSL